jgi:hypothetical protein
MEHRLPLLEVTLEFGGVVPSARMGVFSLVPHKVGIGLGSSTDSLCPCGGIDKTDCPMVVSGASWLHDTTPGGGQCQFAMTPSAGAVAENA